MPKASGFLNKPVHIPNPRPVAVKRIRLSPATDGPHRHGLSSTASNRLAAEAVRMAGSPGGISGKQQVY